MSFLEGLAAFGSGFAQESQDLKSKQAIAAAHLAQAQKQQQSDALSQLMSLFGGGPIPGFGGAPPSTGGPQGDQTGAAPLPSPAAQAPPGGAQQPATAYAPQQQQGGGQQQAPVPQAPASTPPAAAVSGTPTPAAPPPAQPAAQLGQANTTIAQKGMQPMPADLQPPAQGGGPSFSDRFGQGQAQGAQVQAKPVKTQSIGRGPPQAPIPGQQPTGKGLYNVASQKEQAAIQAGQPQGQQVAQADPITQKLQEAARRGDQSAAQTLADPQKLQVLRGAASKYQELSQKLQKWEAQRKNMEAGRDIQRQTLQETRRHREIVEGLAAQSLKDKEQAAQKKEQDYKDKIDTLVRGLKEGTADITGLSKKEIGDVEAAAIKQGFNYRAKLIEQKAENAYEQSAGRMGATIKTRVDFSSRELAKAIDQARKTSEALPRGEYMPFNRAIQEWFKKPFGDPAFNQHMAALQTARNMYARLMNPMGVPRVTDAANLRFDNMMTTALGPKALEAQFQQLWNEAVQMQQAAAAMKPGSSEFEQPIKAPESISGDPNTPLSITVHPGGGAEGGGDAPPASMLQEGVKTKFKGGKGTWTLQNGKPVRVDQ